MGEPKKKTLVQRIVQAAQRSALAENPAGLMAAGWEVDDNGEVHQGDPEREGARQLRSVLAAEGAGAALGLAAGAVPAAAYQAAGRGIVKGLELTSPSHWTNKLAARLALTTDTAKALGIAADIGVPTAIDAYDIYSDVSDAVKEKRESPETYDSDKAIRKLSGDFLRLIPDIIVPSFLSTDVLPAIRRNKQLGRLFGAKKLDNVSDVADNLIDYHAPKDSRRLLQRLRDTEIAFDDTIPYGSAAEYALGANKIYVRPQRGNDYLELGKKYTDALLAHEGTHGVLDPNYTQFRDALVHWDDSRGYWAADPLHNDYDKLLTVFDDTKGLSKWQRSPEEFVAEMGFLRQLTGQNKNFNDMSKFYQNRFDKYMSKRFDMPKETVHNLQSELSKMYAGGGAIERMAEVYGNDREAMLAMVKKLREKRK